MTPEELQERIESAGYRITLSGFVSAATAALVLGVGLRTVRQWRAEGRGPVAARLNARVWYHLSDLADFLNDASGEKRQNPAEPGESLPTPLAEPRLRSGAKK
jgi:hypothetical protein